MDRIEFEITKRQLSESGSLKIKIASQSMVPVLQKGDDLEAQPLPKQLKMFDLVIYYSQNYLTCHFFWKDQRPVDNSVVTRSLAEPFWDEIPIPVNDILGWVPTKKIPAWMKFKILILNLFRGSLN